MLYAPTLRVAHSSDSYFLRKTVIASIFPAYFGYEEEVSC